MITAATEATPWDLISLSPFKIIFVVILLIHSSESASGITVQSGGPTVCCPRFCLTDSLSSLYSVCFTKVAVICNLIGGMQA